MANQWLSWLKNHGWKAETAEKPNHELPEEIRSRYPGTGQAWSSFIEPLAVLMREDETAWFLCFRDFCRKSGNAFQWDAWERLSLESAGDDAEWAASIRAFWDGHFPIILSVKNRYAYYAMSIETGSIVYGEEPEFEECRVVAASFEAFMEEIRNGKIQI